MKKFLPIVLLILSAASALASDLTIPQSTLYPYKSTIELQDDFISGLTTNGTLGALGWIVNGGTNSTVTSIANRVGIFRKDTTGVPSTLAILALYGGSSAIDSALPHRIVWVAALGTNDANTTIRLGTLNSDSVSPPSHGIFIEKLDADTNWFCVTRAGGVQTRTDSTVAITTSYTTFVYTRNSSGVQFSLDGVNVCSLMTTNIPTTFTNPALHIINSAAAAKTVDVDYFEMKITGLTR